MAHPVRLTVKKIGNIPTDPDLFCVALELSPVKALELIEKIKERLKEAEELPNGAELISMMIFVEGLTRPWIFSPEPGSLERSSGISFPAPRPDNGTWDEDEE